MPTTTDRPPRAAALPPDERRAAIVAAALPLMAERGTNVTTKQLAEAAGIAEGTIFRVFPDKEALLQAVIDAAVDHRPLEAAIAAIDRGRPFEQQLEDAVAILQHHLLGVWRLMSSIAQSGTVHKPAAKPFADITALAELFEPERARLRHEPTRAARILRSLTMASSHPALASDEPLSPAEIVSLLLDGVRTRTPSTRTTSSRERAPRC